MGSNNLVFIGNETFVTEHKCHRYFIQKYSSWFEYENANNAFSDHSNAAAAKIVISYYP